jgi:hypothetical protein
MIREVEAIVAPPRKPRALPNPQDWARCERELGIAIPNDYRALVDRYGTAVFGEFIVIFSPAAKSKYVNLVESARDFLAGARELREDLGDEWVPYPLHPEKGGLLPFGNTVNGDLLFWLTRGSPSKWKVVVNATRSPDYEEFNMSATTFIARVLRGDVRPEHFPEDLWPAKPTAIAMRGE